MCNTCIQYMIVRFIRNYSERSNYIFEIYRIKNWIFSILILSSRHVKISGGYTCSTCFCVKTWSIFHVVSKVIHMDKFWFPWGHTWKGIHHMCLKISLDNKIKKALWNNEMGVKIQNSLPWIGFIDFISTKLNIYQTT